MVRHRLTDRQWRRIEHLFPKRARTGRPPADRRNTFEGILWILRTGAPWRDLPEEFGKWSTVWEWFDRWNADGTLAAVLKELQGRAKINRQLWCIDGTVIRAARCAAGGGKKGVQTSPKITL